MRCIAGFEPVDAGVIRAHGRVLASKDFHSPPESRQIGMVFQDYALFPHLTVLDNVAFGLHRLDRGKRKRRAEEILETVGLGEHRGHYPHQLSGGQQQRVALARALAPEPEIVLLDEPFSSLDVELRERLSVEVRSVLKTLNTTALLVTHDQQEAFAVADVVGVMKEGKLEQWDTPYELYHRPETRFVADFIGQGVFIPGEIVAAGSVRTELGVVRANGNGQWQTGRHRRSAVTARRCHSRRCQHVARRSLSARVPRGGVPVYVEARERRAAAVAGAEPSRPRGR